MGLEESDKHLLLAQTVYLPSTAALGTDYQDVIKAGGGTGQGQKVRTGLAQVCGNPTDHSYLGCWNARGFPSSWSDSQQQSWPPPTDHYTNYYVRPCLLQGHSTGPP